MREQQPRSGAAQLGGREIGEVARILIKLAGPRPGRQAARPHRATLAAPVETPHRDAAAGEIADGLELLLDEFAKAADHDAFDPRVADRQMTPAQDGAVGSGEAAPRKIGRRQKALVERWPAERFSPKTCRRQAVGHAQIPNLPTGCKPRTASAA